MFGLEQLERLWSSLLGLGARRLAGLGLVGLTVFAAVGFGSYYLSRPDFETLYIGLNAQDVSRIGAALKEAGITFDVNSQGNAVSVRRGQTAQARMLLAEKGLPTSSNAGYELFDKMGSMGLTSFMQEITRVRALEGEIARTIQAMKGVKAARVHIVLPDAGSFRRTRQQPSASVIIRTESVDDFSSAAAIRHLVAAAVPGMTVDQVTVLNTDGVLMAAGSDAFNASPAKMLTLEKTHRQGVAGQRHADAGALSGPRQHSRQRGAAPQHRQAPDQRDELQSRGQGGAVGAHRQGDRQLAEQQRQQARPSASSRTFRRTRQRPPAAASRTRSRTSAARS